MKTPLARLVTKAVVLLVGTLMAVATARAANTTYYSQGSLDATAISSWNSNRGGGGSVPTDFTTAGDVFVIQSGHAMITAAGPMWPPSGTINKIQVESGGTLTATLLIGVSTFQVDKAGTYIHNALGSTAGGSAGDFPGTTRTLATTSNVEIQKWANGGSPAALPVVTWGNLTINVTTPNSNSWNQQGNLATVKGNFTLKACAFPSFRLAANSPASMTCNVDGDMVIQGGVFTVSSGTSTVALNVGGNFNQTGGTFQTTGVTTVTFTGGASGNATFSSSAGTLTSTSLHWGVAAGKTVTINAASSSVLLGDCALAGALRISMGASPIFAGTTTIAGTGSVTVDDGCALYTAGPLANGGTMAVNGTLRFNAGGSFSGTPPVYGGNSILLYARSATVGGEWGPGTSAGPGVPQNVQIKAGGLSSSVTLSGNRSVPGTLSFASPGGLLATGSYAVAPYSTVGAPTWGWVNGNEQRAVLGAGGGTFDIGDATNYTPVVLAFPMVITPGSLTVGTSASAHPALAASAIDPAKSVKRYWTITNSGLSCTYNATLNFVPGDVQGGADYNRFVVGRYEGGWSYPAVGTRSASSIQANGLTSFGDFAIGEQGRWILTASATAGGVISPSGAVAVAPGGSQSFTATAGVGHHLVDLVVDGVSQGPVTGYTFTSVAANHTIRAQFVSDSAPSDLVAWYAMDEGQGLVAGDGSGHGNDATLPNGASWPAGKVGTALGLNGGSTYGLAPSNNTLDFAFGLTLATWIRPTTTATQNLLSKAVNGGTDGFELNLSSAGHPFVRLNQLSLTPRLDAVATYPTDGSTWMHVAATFDGTYLRIYVNGVEDNAATVSAGLAVRPNTLPLSIGAQVDAGGVASRYFVGAIDDARVYGRALSAAEVRVLAGLPTYRITASAGPGGSITPSGTVVVIPDASQAFTIVASAGYDIADVLVDGASVGPVATYTFDHVASNHTIAASFAFRNAAPAPPVVVAPADHATGVSTSPSFDVTVSDPDGDPLTVTYYARPADQMVPAPDFSLVVLPDAQNYTGSLNGGSPAILTSQTQWIVNGLPTRHTAYVAQVGDLSNDGDRYEVQWQAADAAFRLIEDPVTTGLPDGLPYGVAVGNHEQVPTGATLFYNQYFGAARFAGRGYYGGHYGVNSNNHYDRFSASGMDFLAIHLEIASPISPAVLTWADNLLKTNPSRRGIVVSHYLIDPGDPGAWSAQGQSIYDALKGNPNLFLMLSGHVTTEGRRTDTYGGGTVHTLLADYQGRTNGGDGWLRLLEFSPATDLIHVRTYSPWLDQWETDASSQFDLTYDMPATMHAPFSAIGTVSGVASGTTVSLPWPGREPSTAYEWYVTVSDAKLTTLGPTWTFTTGTGGAPGPLARLSAAPVRAGSLPPGSTAAVGLSWSAAPPGTTVEVWRAGFGHYPRYDAAGGYTPEAPTTWSDPPAPGWTLAGSVAAPDTAWSDVVEARDVYHYVAFVKDAGGACSPASSMTGGTLNYLLGDVSNGAAPCAGDNAVTTADISLLGASYGVAVGENDPLACLDVGPTTDLSPTGRPDPDGWLDFEDLVMFALNYTGSGGGGRAAPTAARPAGAAGSASANANAVALLVPESPGTAGGSDVTIQASGTGDVHALALELGYDATRLEMAGADAGELLARQGLPSIVLSPGPGRVDVALLGSGPGLRGSGELLTVHFRRKAPGAAPVTLLRTEARGQANQKLTLGSSPGDATLTPPSATAFAFAQPNPFQRATTLGFALARGGPVELAVYAVDGRRVITLLKETRAAGWHQLAWDGRDARGQAVRSGVYFARLQTPDGSFRRTVVRMK